MILNLWQQLFAEAINQLSSSEVAEMAVIMRTCTLIDGRGLRVIYHQLMYQRYVRQRPAWRHPGSDTPLNLRDSHLHACACICNQMHRLIYCTIGGERGSWHHERMSTVTHAPLCRSVGPVQM
jgi:hypothetical protein